MKILSPARTIDDLYFLCFQGLNRIGLNFTYYGTFTLFTENESCSGST